MHSTRRGFLKAMGGALAAVRDLIEDDREEVRIAARQVVTAHADACADPVE